MFERSPLLFARMTVWDLMSSDLEPTHSGQFGKEATEVFLTANNWSTVSIIHYSLTLVQESKNIHKKRACSIDHEHHYTVSHLFKRVKTAKRKEGAALTMLRSLR